MKKKREQKKEDPKEGIIIMTAKGDGFVQMGEKDIRIRAENTNTALHGDTVLIKTQKRGSRAEGVVENVVHRAKTTFVGTPYKDKGNWFLKADHKKTYVHFKLTGNTKILKEDQKAVVEFLEWNEGEEHPIATVTKALGKKGEHEVEMQAIVLDKGFVLDFPHDVEQAADKIDKTKDQIFKREEKKRRDFRDTLTFTIDPHDAKDFDDAISFRKIDEGLYEIGVHIADVSAYVKNGDAIDVEAQERGTSIYLVDRTIPMLPEVLSNGVCSLRPNEEKLTFSAVFVMNENAEVHDEWYGETMINSDRRFTYAEAQELIEGADGDYAEEIRICDALSLKLREKRLKKGSIDFDQDEIEFELDETGKPVRVYRKERKRANMLIEDFMLLANQLVAKHVNDLAPNPDQRPVFVYRIHNEPDPDKIEELGIFLRAIGYEFDTNKGIVTQGTLNKLFKEIEGTDEEALIKKATIRSMAKAVYATKNVGHFGLAFKYYTHFTSPIRRYPDLMVHRLMKRYLGGQKIPRSEMALFERLSIQSSEREASAVEAERESIKLKQVEFLKDKVGEEFDAVVSGVTDWGFFVEEIETKAEGLVPLSTLKDDFYQVSDSRYALVGVRGKKFALGDRVRVKLTGADLEQKQLNFEIV